MAANTYGRANDVPMTNKSGGGVIAGDVVIYDTTNNLAFTTTTSASSTLACGVAQETIANNATGRIRTVGYCALINVNASVTRGHYGATYTVAKQATDAGASRAAGTFVFFTSGGTTPDGIVYPVDLAGAALTNPMTTAGDIIYGGASGTPTRKAVGTSGQLLGADGTNPLWLSGSSILLDYALGSDITNQAITANTFFDVISNQNFTKAYTASIIEVVVRGYGFFNDNVANSYLSKIVIDSAGTPTTKYLSGSNNVTGLGANERANNLFDSPPVFISGLSAATHTIKASITATGNNDHFYCRASTNGPATGPEFFNVQVIEHL